MLNQIFNKILTFINFNIYPFRNELKCPPKYIANQISWIDIKDVELFNYNNNGFRYHVIKIDNNLKMYCFKERL